MFELVCHLIRLKLPVIDNDCANHEEFLEVSIRIERLICFAWVECCIFSVGYAWSAKAATSRVKWSALCVAARGKCLKRPTPGCSTTSTISDHPSCMNRPNLLGGFGLSRFLVCLFMLIAHSFLFPENIQHTILTKIEENTFRGTISSSSRYIILQIMFNFSACPSRLPPPNLLGRRRSPSSNSSSSPSSRRRRRRRDSESSSSRSRAAGNARPAMSATRPTCSSVWPVVLTKLANWATSLLLSPSTCYL